MLDNAAPYEPVAGKVEVVEFFGYWCPHCNAFEPELETWLKRLPSNVSFKRVPVAFNQVHEPLQKLYYALESLGRVGDMQRKVFTAIHAEKINLNSQDAIVASLSTPKLPKPSNWSMRTKSMAFLQWVWLANTMWMAHWQKA